MTAGIYILYVLFCVVIAWVLAWTEPVARISPKAPERKRKLVIKQNPLRARRPAGEWVDSNVIFWEVEPRKETNNRSLVFFVFCIMLPLGLWVITSLLGLTELLELMKSPSHR